MATKNRRNKIAMMLQGFGAKLRLRRDRKKQRREELFQKDLEMIRERQRKGEMGF